MVTINGRKYSRGLVCFTHILLCMTAVMTFAFGVIFTMIKPFVGSCFFGFSLDCVYMSHIYSTALFQGSADANVLCLAALLVVGICPPLAIILVLRKSLIVGKRRNIAVALAVLWGIYLAVNYFAQCLKMPFG